jgi:hypothetical protein
VISARLPASFFAVISMVGTTFATTTSTVEEEGR